MWGVSTSSIMYFLILGKMFPTAAIPVSYSRTELKLYIEMFEVQSILHGAPANVSEVTVSFMDNEYIKNESRDSCKTRSRILGYCDNNGPVPVILINRSFWKKSDFSERLALVFHELGHCLLGRRHKDGEFSLGGSNHPASILHSRSKMGLDTMEYYDYYMDELFTHDDAELLTQPPVYF
jgi:hypothetical protein